MVHVAVGDVVSRTAGNLQRDAVVLGELSLLEGDESGMCQHVDVGVLHGGPVGAGRHGFGDGLAVHDDPFRTVLTRFLGDLCDLPRGDVGDLHAGDDLAVVLAELARLDDVGNHPLDVAHVDVVGDGYDLVSEDLGPPDEFRGDELPVAVDGVGVKVCSGNHLNASR